MKMAKPYKEQLLDYSEQNFNNNALAAYKAARDNIKLELSKLEEKGLLTNEQMNKYNRLDALQKQITNEMKNLRDVSNGAINSASDPKLGDFQSFIDKLVLTDGSKATSILARGGRR